MHHNYFLKEPIGDMLLSLIIVCGFVIAALLMWIGYICEKTVIFGIATVAVILFAICVYKCIENAGLYIVDTDVYYKGVRRKKFKIQHIAGVKVLKTYAALKHRGFYPIIENNGDGRYFAIFLSEVKDVMRGYSQGDLWFNQEYRDFVICSGIYEKNAIDYLKSINPNMEIMYSND